MLHDCLNNIHFHLARPAAIILILAVGLVSVSCSSDSQNGTLNVFDSSNESMVLVLKDQREEFSRDASSQIQKALEYTKIPFLTEDLGIITREFNISSHIRSVIVTNQSITQLTDSEIQELVDFTAGGGSLVFVGPISDTRFSFLQGLKAEASFDPDSTNKGFRLVGEAFPGMQGKVMNMNGLQPHFGLQGSDFYDDIDILATTATNQEQPLITSNKIGLGEVITLNSFVVSGKLYRGLVFSSILRGLKGIPYQVANVSTIFLDDFPAPLYNEKLPPIDWEYDITHAEFVSKVWWPDMKALADSFDIDYAAMVAFNYNANVVPPFDFQEWRQGSIVFNQNIVEGSIYLAKDIRDTRHELAFHGYNHFSLWQEDWDNINFMISALQAARKRWQVDNLGRLPTNYVPPTNNIDSLGLEALVRGMPSIRYMSSLYFGDIEEGGGREFDPDPYVPAQIFNYPRISSGFTMETNSLLNQHGMQLLTGVWTHFIHPDDVFLVVQRDEDEFTSRNPLGLGWMTSRDRDYGLYHLLSRRIKHTLQHYPTNDFVSASDGAMKTEDWRRSLTAYETRGKLLEVLSSYRENYTPNFEGNNRSWFMYVPSQNTFEMDMVLKDQNIQAKKSTIWNGYLYQFNTDNQVFFLPDLSTSTNYDRQFVEALKADVNRQYQSYQQVVSEEQAEEAVDWRDTRLEDAVRAWRRNPGSIANQERLISLSIEFSQVERAITILENRMLNSEYWVQEDMERLLTYYGWEGLQSRAEEFLEQLWRKYQNANVIAFKNMAVNQLGLFGTEFERRWRLRELQLAPNDYELLLSYTKSIESQENWPEMKQNLRQLLEMRPQTDSLYAFTLQRSFYYESADSTLALVEEFPEHSYNQLLPFASNLAMLYGFNSNDYEQALFWANNTPDFDPRTELFWVSQLNLNSLYKAKAMDYLANNSSDSEVRSYVGTNLFYRGFTEEAYQVLYPLFENNNEGGLPADTLLRNEIGFLSYPQKKTFYGRYPRFFDPQQVNDLQRQYRENEGIRGQVFGEYRDDNFENTFARGGVSAQWGNRLNRTHLVKTEYLVFADDNPQTNLVLQYQGIGYEFARRSMNQQLEFRAGPTILFGEGEFIPEGMISLGFSQDSSFTSLQLTGGAELTSTSLQNDYYQSQLQLYRQDFWFDGLISTGLSATGKYYTNNVFRYGTQARVYLELMETKWRLRPLGEIGYSDATQSYLTGIPYYTPDQYFSQGIGLDLRYRNPDIFDYKTQLTAEIMGKHERREGIFATGRIQLEHRFDNFWEISIGSEISTSQVYRSNRIFFTVTHYFPRTLRISNQ